MKRKRIYTTMFHPEVVHTPDGAKLIAQFCVEDCWLQARLDHGGIPAGSD